MARSHGPWTIEGTTLKYRNEHLELREDQVIQPDGEPGTYATVTAPCGVLVLPLDDEGSVYLTRQFRYAIGRESVEVVAGGIEEQESPLAAARREALEELGIEAAEWSELGTIDVDTSLLYSPMHLFLARRLTFTEPEREGTETIRTVKVPLDEAARMVRESRITHAASCVLILRAWCEPEQVGLEVDEP